MTAMDGPQASNDYSFLTIWRVAGDVDEVTAILGDGESLPRWWPAVYLDVRSIRSGDACGVGRVLDLYTKGFLPYTLRWRLTITEPITEKGFALSADGDLIGTGRWTFVQDGPEVVITYDWRGRAAKPAARPTPLAAAPGLRGEPPLGHGAWGGEPAAGAAPAARDLRGCARARASSSRSDVRM